MTLTNLTPVLVENSAAPEPASFVAAAKRIMPYYYLADWHDTGSGFAPNFPEGSSFVLLAAPGGDAPYGLFLCSRSPAEITSPDIADIEQVPPDLANLLQSAEGYPPAIALARDEVAALTADVPRSDFVLALAERLRHYLETQRSAPYFLCQMAQRGDGHRTVGAYYWVVGYRPERPRYAVRWVSGDYHVYSDPLADFDVDAEFLTQRFASRSVE